MAGIWTPATLTHRLNFQTLYHLSPATQARAETKSSWTFHMQNWGFSIPIQAHPNIGIQRVSIYFNMAISFPASPPSSKQNLNKNSNALNSLSAVPVKVSSHLLMLSWGQCFQRSRIGRQWGTVVTNVNSGARWWELESLLHPWQLHNLELDLQPPCAPVSWSINSAEHLLLASWGCCKDSSDNTGST